LTFDLLTSGSVHAEVLHPALLLIAWVVFLLERGQTDKQTDRQTQLNRWTTYPTPAAIQGGPKKWYLY